MKTVASEEHLKLSSEIKALHATLRQRTKKVGAKKAWQEHLQAKSRLQSYAKAMKELAVNHWEANNRKKQNDNEKAKKHQERSRITWTVNYCRDYFLSVELVQRLRQRELRILDELNIDCTKINETMSQRAFPVKKINLLDVGSCYNPFKQFTDFEVVAIDIAPAIDDVFECDFLNVQLGDRTDTVMDETKPRSISTLQTNGFDVVVFSLLLEYLPTSEQRLKCCEKAYELLQNEGLLCIITPDSKHPGINAQLMKTWRYALAQIGFGRIKIDKLEHITCMVFRKCLDPEVSRRWARMHKEPYMDYKLEIPQDSNETDDNKDEEKPESDATNDSNNANATNDLNNSNDTNSKNS